jgi:hypothetical protein
VVGVYPPGEGRYEVACAPAVDLRARLARTIVERGWELLELRAVGMSLEDIFLQLTTRDTADRNPKPEAEDTAPVPEAVMDEDVPDA